MSRMTDLLNKAADALDEGTDPFSEHFLGKNDVTFDECMSMAELMALSARGAAWLMANPRKARAILEGAANGARHNAFMEAMERLDRARADR